MNVDQFVLMAWTTLASVVLAVGLSSTDEGVTKTQSVLRPRFASAFGQNYSVLEGEHVMLLCRVVNLGSSVVVWKLGSRMISAGDRLIRKDSRMRLMSEGDGVHLSIDNVDIEDAGVYVCDIESFADPISQHNTLNVLVPARVRVAGGRRVVRAERGDDVELTCIAQGSPQPKVQWEKEFSMLPSGAKHEMGNSLKLADVDRTHAGKYECSADNGVGDKVVDHVNLVVSYAPEVEAEKSWVHADIGAEIVLACVVHAQPEAKVRWYRETMVLESNENMFEEQFGVRHALVLRKVRPGDFANYSCAAENELGRARSTMQLAGEPAIESILSSALGRHSDKFNLTWRVVSKAELLQHRIAYRKANEEAESRGRWHEFVPSPEQLYVSEEKDSRREVSHVFYALEPSSKYEVRVSSRNQFGWSHYTQPFFFNTTRAPDFRPKVDASSSQHSLQQKESASSSHPTVRSEQKSSSSTLSSWLPLVGFALLAPRMHRQAT